VLPCLVASELSPDRVAGLRSALSAEPDDAAGDDVDELEAVDEEGVLMRVVLSSASRGAGLRRGRPRDRSDRTRWCPGRAARGSGHAGGGLIGRACPASTGQLLGQAVVGIEHGLDVRSESLVVAHFRSVLDLSAWVGQPQLAGGLLAAC